MKYSAKPLTVAQIRSRARKLAREAGLDPDTADAIASRVVERMRPHVEVDDLIRDEIQKHSSP